MRSSELPGRVACLQAAETNGIGRSLGGKRSSLMALFVMANVSVTWGQRALTDIPNPDPNYQQSLLTPAEGFEVSLYASDPMISKPIAMSFDHKGRLWVAGSETYPQIVPGQMPSDKIYRLEDMNGDGRIDKSTVFAEGLLVPTAILATPEGVYVGNSTELLFFEDADDDGVADSKRVVLSGFGTEDTHHIVHTLRSGPAGRIYFNQSIYIHSYIETPHGLRELKAGGVWRLRPETLELDVFNRGLINSWGLQWDEWGQSFQSDGAGFEGLSYSFPGAVFRTARGFDRYLPGLNPGQPKFSGLEIVAGGLFPEEWQGRLVTCDFRGNRISVFEPSDSNCGFITSQREDILTSTHGAFRPIDLQMGPDGALYVADWYNPIIQHGEVDFRDERRDRSHGRIWRIAAKDVASIERPQLDGASVGELLDYLKSDESYARAQAKLLLKSRGAEAVKGPLTQWLASLDATGERLDRLRLEALWVSQSLGRPDLGLVKQLLASTDFRARSAAVRVLEEHPERFDGIFGLLENAVQDEHPRVRLEAMHVLRALGGVEAAELAGKAYRDSMDETYDFGLWYTLRELADDWLPFVERDPRLFGDNTKRLIFAVRCVEDDRALNALIRLWEDGAIEVSAQVGSLRAMAELGNPETLTRVWKETLRRAEASEPGVTAILESMEIAATKRKAVPIVAAGEIARLMESGDAKSREEVARLAGSWKANAAVPVLEGLVRDESVDATLSAAAVDGLARMKSPSSKQALARLCGENQSMDIRLRAAAGYAQAAPSEAIPFVVGALSQTSPGKDARPLLRPYLAKANLANRLAEGFGDATIDGDVATALLRMFGSLTIEAGALEEALQIAGGVETINQAMNAEEMAAFIDYAIENGDPRRGEQVYRQESLLCLTCHAIGGSGGSLGPDLTSIGASAPMDYIVDSLLEPQKKIKEGYHVVSVAKKDGASLAGTLASEDANSIVLRDMSDNRVTIAKSDIASQTISPVSLMPPGLTASLRKDELADLVVFLSRIGKEGAYKVSSKPMLRTFRYLDNQDGDRAFADIVRHKPIEYVTGDDSRLVWNPAYSKVDGALPLDEIDALRRGRDEFQYARFDIDVKRGGEVGLLLNDADTARMWVGQEEVAFDGSLARFQSEQGRQTVTLVLSRYDRKNRDLSIEIADIPGSSAQVQTLNGK